MKRLQVRFLLVLCLVTSLSEAAPPEWCVRRILDLQKAGPGFGFLYLPDIQREVADWGNRLQMGGSENSVFFGNIYVCDSCSRPNGSKDRQGKFVDCKGCGHPIDKNTEVHKIFTQGNIRLAHIESVFFAGDSLGELVATPWTCAYCGNKNQANQHHCASCGSDPYSGHPKDFVRSPIPHGVDLIMIPDSSEFDGYRLEARVGKAALVARETGKVLARAAGPVAPYFAPVMAPIVNRAQQMTRRQWIASAVGAAGALTGFTWWAMQPYVPNLPPTQTVSAVVVERHMVRRVGVMHKVGDRLEEMEPLINEYHATQVEPVNAPGLIDWKLPPPKITNNTREYRQVPHEEHQLIAVSGSFRAELPMAPAQIAQYRVGDKVTLVIAKGGAEIGIRRELP